MPSGSGSQYLPHFLLTSKTSGYLSCNVDSWETPQLSVLFQEANQFLTIRPALDARHVTPSALRSESLAPHALTKRLTVDELTKGIALDAGKAIPVSLLLAWFQSIFPYPKPANSDPPAPPPQQQQLPQSGVVSPQNPSGSYYPGGAPINQEPPGQVTTPPQSYYDPRTNSQVSYQDPRLQDPRYLAPLQQQQAQNLAYAGGPQPPPQDSQPVQGFGRAEVDLSNMTPQGH